MSLVGGAQSSVAGARPPRRGGRRFKTVLAYVRVTLPRGDAGPATSVGGRTVAHLDRDLRHRARALAGDPDAGAIKRHPLRDGPTVTVAGSLLGLPPVQLTGGLRVFRRRCRRRRW